MSLASVLAFGVAGEAWGWTPGLSRPPDVLLKLVYAQHEPVRIKQMRVVTVIGPQFRISGRDSFVKPLRVIRTGIDTVQRQDGHIDSAKEMPHEQVERLGRLLEQRCPYPEHDGLLRSSNRPDAFDLFGRQLPP